jgi:hypothetical protein
MPLAVDVPRRRPDDDPAAPRALAGLSADQLEWVQAIGIGVLLGVSYVAAIIGAGLWMLHRR